MIGIRKWAVRTGPITPTAKREGAARAMSGIEVVRLRRVKETLEAPAASSGHVPCPSGLRAVPAGPSLEKVEPEYHRLSPSNPHTVGQDGSRTTRWSRQSNPMGT
jgi:hypothetical protein